MHDGQVEAQVKGTTWVLSLSGYATADTSGILRTSVGWCVASSRLTAIECDLTRCAGLSTEVVRAIVEAMLVCHDNGLRFKVFSSARAREDLDEAGLWWVGVIDDGIAAELVMGDAFNRFAEEKRLGRMGDTGL